MMRYTIIREFPATAALGDKGPQVTICLPTHRQLPERRQDVVLYRQLLKEAEEALIQGYREEEYGEILEALQGLGDDQGFWEGTRDGLAVLAGGKGCQVYILGTPLEPVAAVGEGLRLRPLLEAFQKDRAYEVLGISGREFRVFRGNREELVPLDLGPDVPRTIEEILGPEHTEKYTTAGTYGADGGAFFHGQGSKKDDVKQDLENFYRQVDKLVYEHVSAKSRLPLILANLHERLSLFRKVAKNPFLLEEGADYSYDTHNLETLRERAWAIMEEEGRQKDKGLAARFQEAWPKGLGSNQLEEARRAAQEGRVEVLLLEEGRTYPGEEEALDEVVRLVIEKQGEVRFLKREDLSVAEGLAAIFRY